MQWKMEEAFSDCQVFINHRGPDTKSNLASLLYETLRRSGLRVFLDREELPTGNSVSPQIRAAIVSSSVHIAIFSPKYAESQWCLDELCMMLEQRCHRSTIIPIFCDVKPSDLRRVNEGQYAKAFGRHKDRGRMEVERWEEALKNVADIKGHEFHMGKEDWGKFVYEIVDIVQKKVIKEPLVVAEHPVGLHKAAANLYNGILKHMQPSGNTTVVGIAGLSGSGKTTLAAHFYNLKHSQFKRSSFLYKVSGSRSALTSAQQKLLFDLLDFSHLNIGSPEEGTSLLLRLKGFSRVLIVLDGIDRQEQIDSLLLPVKDLLVDGSLIVITSRDKDLLARCQVSFLYDMELLDEKDARKLFCHHAFLKSEVPTKYDDLVREMVKMCGGYPSALKDLGARLLGKHMGHWKAQLTNLQNNQFPNEIVENILKATYDSLEEEAKVVFLDVASFFEGVDSHVVVRFEEEVECPLLNWIETLGQKCLVEFLYVEVDVDGRFKYNDGEHEVLRPYNRSRSIMNTPYRDCKIGMHKLVVDMAKKIASEEPSRCISSDHKLSYSFQQMLKGPPPHFIIQNCYGLKGFGYLKYGMDYKKESHHSKFLGHKKESHHSEFTGHKNKKESHHSEFTGHKKESNHSELLGLRIIARTFRRKLKAFRNDLLPSRIKRNEDTDHEVDVELDECFPHGPRRFSYAELADATRNYSDKIGEGGFGGVYRGVLAGTNEKLAVKRMFHESNQGREAYVSEVSIMSKLRHRNLVHLLGWCHEKGELLLVYEFQSNGALDKHLFAGITHLGWKWRYNIAYDVASALVYLHEDCDHPVVHRDVKPSNILLDSNFNARLADFGLARLLGRNEDTHLTTAVAGTRGYLAPESLLTGKVSPESDVFSFGAVALDIACGKRSVDLPEHGYTVEWVWNLYGQGKILEAADEKLGGDFKAEEMERLMAVGLLCSHPDPKARPSMRQVLKVLKFEAELPYVPLNFPVPVYNDYFRPYGSSSGTSMTL